MVTTRGMMKNQDKKTRLKTRRKLYRSRTKESDCRKKTQKKCKYTSGKKRKYCRKTKNSKRMKDKLFAKKK